MKLLFCHSVQEKINLAPCTFSWTHFIYHYLQKCKIDKPDSKYKVYHIQKQKSLYESALYTKYKLNPESKV